MTQTVKVTCEYCQKAYGISRDRIKELGGRVSFTCPSCKQKVSFDFRKPEKSVSVDTGGLPSGVQLRSEIVEAVRDLPAMPQVVQKAQQVMTDESSGIADLTRVIETDQAIAARVLKLANSAFYNARGKVASLQTASVMLGMKTLNELLTLACTARMLDSKLDGYNMQAGDLWRHSLAVAGCARAMADKKDPELADDAFAAGLIHDCGKLVLDTHMARRRSAVSAFLAGGEKSFLDAEKEVLGFDHAQIAADICSKWFVPKHVASAVKYHHAPHILKKDMLTAIVHAADAIVLMSSADAKKNGSAGKIDAGVMKLLDLNDSQISMFLALSIEYFNMVVRAV
ncbi:MAG: HDOD domain-containing protein [Deltaproteobacteria bacterium]|nr:HDOD domain-containing protein [Deltaproteobacteria bacterium]